MPGRRAWPERGKSMKLLLKIIGKLIKWSAVIFGVLFTIYMLNLDMKLVGWLYKWLNKFHDRRDGERDVAF